MTSKRDELMDAIKMAVDEYDKDSPYIADFKASVISVVLIMFKQGTIILNPNDRRNESVK